jgi:hypothetical protein
MKTSSISRRTWLRYRSSSWHESCWSVRRLLHKTFWMESMTTKNASGFISSFLLLIGCRVLSIFEMLPTSNAVRGDMLDRRYGLLLSIGCFLIGVTAAGAQDSATNAFLTSERCLICHSNLKTSKGEDASIGTEWRSSMMANSARDPYWLASVRRETLDHARQTAEIENACANCHMPLTQRIDHASGQQTVVFAHLPFHADNLRDTAAEGVACTVCHQIQSTGLGTVDTYNGNFHVAAVNDSVRPLYGPFPVDAAKVAPLHLKSSGYSLAQSEHLSEAALCGSCHTLYTKTIATDGEAAVTLPEQMVYLEWQHSDYRDKQTCQHCHMPAVGDTVKIAVLYSDPKRGVRRHSFVGSNFLMQRILNAHRNDLGVAAPEPDLEAAATRTVAYLQSQAAHLSLGSIKLANGEIRFTVKVENLTGHKLPTSFPSRRAWLHVTVAAADGRILFESGKLRTDGSIEGNANDADPARYMPHFTKITSADQVQIFEPILGDRAGHVTTGLLTATQYLKDNRILPAGFDNGSASADIAVHGEAASDPAFKGGSSTTQYQIPANAAPEPFRIEVELFYQPIGYRWARNLAAFQSDETKHFVDYFEQAAPSSAVVLAHAEMTNVHR